MYQLHAGPLVPAPQGTKTRMTGVSGVSTLVEVPGSGVTSVPITSLRSGDSPRSEGLNQEHVARLADLDGPLPPILVRRSDMQVIDGVHRLLAAFVREQETIDVEFFDGSVE